MYKIAKKTIYLFLALLILTCYSPVSAKEIQKLKAAVQSEFKLKETTEDIVFVTYDDLKIDDNLTLPKGAVIYAKNYQAQRELRWHKSGYIICKVEKYSLNEFNDEIVDISDKELYLIARKYEKVYKKDAAILTTEILLTQGASFFAPGVDVLYFFTKGAILREKDKNWFRAGVSNAYENSVCWFWLKGKPIDLEQGDDIILKSINKEKANSLKTKMTKRKFREDMAALKKELKEEYISDKKTEIAEIKQLKKELKKEEKFAKKQTDNDVITSEKETETEDIQAAAKIKNNI